MEELRTEELRTEEQRQIDETYMRLALKEARKAKKIMEVPIGAVIVYEGKVIGKGYNRRNTKKSTFEHAEITAMKQATKIIGDWRLEETTMYVTLEPCPMCAGAIVQARMKRVVIGAMNHKAGCGGSILNVLEEPRFNHQLEVTRDVLIDECQGIISDFFRELRRSKASPS